MSEETAAAVAALEPLNEEFAQAILVDAGYSIAMAADGSRMMARADRRKAAA